MVADSRPHRSADVFDDRFVTFLVITRLNVHQSCRYCIIGRQNGRRDGSQSFIVREHVGGHIQRVVGTSGQRANGGRARRDGANGV